MRSKVPDRICQKESVLHVTQSIAAVSQTLSITHEGPFTCTTWALFCCSFVGEECEHIVNVGGALRDAEHDAMRSQLWATNYLVLTEYIHIN